MKLIAYGKILKPHGLKGEVKVFPYSGDSGNFKNFTELHLSSSQGTSHKYKISKKRFQKNLIIVSLEGIDNIEKAEQLKGLTVYIDSKELPAKEIDEYYWFELIGLEVFSTDDKLLGQVINIIDNTAQPVLVINNGSYEFMVPFIEKFVKEIDIKSSRIIIEPIEGLI